MASLPHKLNDVVIEEPAETEPARRQIVMLYHSPGACEMLSQANKSILCLRRLDLLGPPRRAADIGAQQSPYRSVVGLTQETHQIWHEGCHDVRDYADLAAERPQKQVQREGFKVLTDIPWIGGSFRIVREEIVEEARSPR